MSPVYKQTYCMILQYEQICFIRAPYKHTCWNRMYLELLAKRVPPVISSKSQAIVTSISYSLNLIIRLYAGDKTYL